MKKMFLICLFFMVIVSSLTMVSAATYENNGITFNIPEGYVQAESYNVTNDYAIEDGTITFFDSDDGVIAISVLSVDPSASMDQLLSKAQIEYSEKSLAGKDGVLGQNGNAVNYVYVEDNKEVSIFAPDEETVETIIGETSFLDALNPFN